LSFYFGVILFDMINLERIFRDERTLQAVLCISAEKFRALSDGLERLHRKSYEHPDRLRAVGAGRKPTLATPEARLAFILFYLKIYPTFDLMGVLFGPDRSECCRWMHHLLPLLEQTLGQRQLLPKRKIRTIEEFWAAFPQAREVLLDGAERPVNRPKQKSRNRKTYSGKKKRHTRKALVMVDGAKRIGYLSPSFRGARHDKRLADRAGIVANIPPEVELFLDSGFQGVRHPGARLPFKGCKRRPLDDAQRTWNRLVSSIRVGVEHAIGGMKRLAAASAVYRNRLPKVDDRFNLLGAGLWNLHLA
jgi:hypothetical protein